MMYSGYKVGTRVRHKATKVEGVVRNHTSNVPDNNVPVTWDDWTKDCVESVHDIELAATSPIREITKREIVPGVYGHVMVDRTANDGRLVLLGFKSTGGVYPETRSLFSADELDAAASVLTQIAAVLRENSNE